MAYKMGKNSPLREELRNTAFAVLSPTSTAILAESSQTNMINGLVSDFEYSFTTDVQHLRIEDTDAYGIMYNGNYLKHYARALESIEKDVNIVGFETMRFSGSPSLGEAFVIRGNRTETSSRWNLRLESAKSKNSKEYNSVHGLFLGEGVFPTESVMEPPLDEYTSTNCLHVNAYTIYKDEFEHNNHLSLATILNYFERPRSQSLGGATGLSKLRDDGIIAVVTRIDNLRLWATKMDLIPGDTVNVHSYAMLRRKSMIRYKQMAYVHGMLLANGEIDVLFIDPTTKRPKPLPEWSLQEIFVPKQ